MGIELPPELADVAAQAGVVWPEADEEAMARQAQAWRDTATSMSTLATDADTTARGALSSVAGGAADAASAEWKKFVEPDTGHLTSVVRDARAAADRLEHAAEQVGAAKVEIVRNLVGLAQNRDAAHAAAAAGHPLALAGLDTAVRGTAANVAHIETQLVSAVQPGAGVDMAAVHNPVNAHPGHHLLPGVVSTATDVVTAATDTVQQTTSTMTGGATGTAPGGGHGLGHLPAAATQATDDVVRHGSGLVTDTVGQVLPDDGRPGHQGPGHVVPGPGDLLPGTTGGHPGNLLPGTGDLLPDGPGHPGGLLPDGPGEHPGNLLPGIGGPGHEGPGDLPPGHAGDVLPGDVVPGQEGPRDPEITGPVPIDLPDDAPTPPTGQTVQAGFAGGLEPSAAPAPNLPPAVAPPAGAAAPQPFGGGTPGFAGGGGPIAGAPPPIAPAPGAAAPAPAAPAAPRPVFAPPAAAVPAPAPQPQPQPQPQSQPDPAPRKQMAGPPGAPPPAKGEKNEALAAFWIHMFPIGHLPVASYKPARQLPPPPPELDYAAGLRFEPADHPDHALVDDASRAREVTAANAARAAAKAAADAAPVPLPPSPPIGQPLAQYPPAPHYPPPGYAPQAGYAPPGSPAAGYPPPAPGYAAPPNHAAVGYPAPGYGTPPDQAASYPAPAQPGDSAAYPGYAASPDRAAGYSAPAQSGDSAAYRGYAASPDQAAGYSAPAQSGDSAVYPGYAASADQAGSYSAPARSGDSVAYTGAAPGQAAQPGAPANHPAPAASGDPEPPADPAAGQSAAAADEPGTVPSLRPVTPGPGAAADSPAVQALLAGHDPLGGGHERDWDRRYLVRLGSVTAQGISPEGLEYNWPTSEQYPEGGSAPGEPEVLDAGAVLDRFGPAEGRVFAADGTPFAQRSLPPALADAGYRRYRATKPLPVWRAVSASWFGQPGGGIRYRTTHSAAELVALGYLEEIT